MAPVRSLGASKRAWQQVTILAGRQELLLSTAKRRKLSWFGHVCRHDTLLKTILEGTLDGGGRRASPRKSWKDNIEEWTGQLMSLLLCIADDRGRWAVIAAVASVGIPQRRMGVTVLVSCEQKCVDQMTDATENEVLELVSSKLNLFEIG